MQISTPVVFIIFNRPDLAEIVFKEISKVKPMKLLVIADGPRFPEEEMKCKKTRFITEAIDWPCDVLRNYSYKNLGCKERISTGLDWVFSHVDSAIILEDDCLPTLSFFPYCETLLEYYRNNNRIMHISGDNFQCGRNTSPFSYYFSKYTHNWGWATWRRAWQYYDKNMSNWLDFKASGLLKSICENPEEFVYWENIFDSTHRGRIDTWDYQWLYTCWIQNGLSIIPEVNLVSNIGFREDATHTTHKNSFASMPTGDIWTVCHPSFITIHRQSDKYTFDHLFYYRGSILDRIRGSRVYRLFSTLLGKTKLQ